MADAAPRRSMEDYEAALKEIEPYFDNVPIVGTEVAARFAFAALIKEFEMFIFRSE